MRRETNGALLALAAAILFGLVAIAAKTTQLPPLLKGGAAYLLAGALLAPFLRNARIQRRDWPVILLMSLAGGAIAPTLLFYGLQQASALHASLLLTFEMVFTAILARILLREKLPASGLIGFALLLASAILVAYASATNGGETGLLGVALILAATLGWGLDNTLSTKLVGSYEPHHMVAIKGLIGGGAAILVFLLLPHDALSLATNDLLAVAYIGVLGIGLSIVLFYRALQRIGATRTSAIFLPGSALAGVIGARVILGDALGVLQMIAGALALVGILLLTRDTTAK